MLKKTLPAAIALAGGLGLAGAANAVNVNHDGTGQVLLYDWYTVEDGKDTLISITNTTDEAVAVKVRFVESMNSQEVLDFNLYLSPYDVWTAALNKASDANGAGAQISTTDTSCTVPAINGHVLFRNLEYVGSDYGNSRGGPQGVDRTATGYLEVIQMGILTNEDTTDSDAFNPAFDATHVNSTPRDCGALVAAWEAGGDWATTDGNAEVVAPQGGLYGFAAAINVSAGTAVAVDAIALDNFYTPDVEDPTPHLHFAPGTTDPTLEQANPDEAVLPNGERVRSSNADASKWGIDAVSIVLMAEKVMNDYVTIGDLGANTDWIVTFPTKRFYVNGWIDANEDGFQDESNDGVPFISWWDATSINGEAGSACESVGVEYWDREENDESPSAVDFSPSPEGVDFALCYEANILSFNSSDIAGGTYTRHVLNLESGFDAGWLALDFTTADAASRIIPLDQGFNNTVNDDIEGLPVIGHAVFELLNNSAGGAGVLANYQYETKHKAAVTSIVPVS